MVKFGKKMTKKWQKNDQKMVKFDEIGGVPKMGQIGKKVDNSAQRWPKLPFLAQNNASIRICTKMAENDTPPP